MTEQIKIGSEVVVVQSANSPLFLGDDYVVTRVSKDGFIGIGIGPDGRPCSPLETHWRANRFKVKSDEVRPIEVYDRDHVIETFHPLPAKRKVVIFNGPPGSGKDTLADSVATYLKARGNKVGRRAFKDELYRLSAEVANVPLDWLIEIATDRQTKEQPCSRLPDNRSPRQWLIHVSEEIIKPNHGKDYFGKALADAIDETDEEYTIVSDGGFYSELDLLAERYGEENVIIFRVCRKGFTFEGDSRNWIDMNGVYYPLIQKEGEPGEAIKNALVTLDYLEV